MPTINIMAIATNRTIEYKASYLEKQQEKKT
jgi:hypothetical protein